MAKSDAEIAITATLDSSQATAGIQQLSTSLQSSMEGAAGATQKLNSGLAETNNQLALSNRQIRMMAVGLAGAGIKIASAVLEARGESKAAEYVKGIGSSALIAGGSALAVTKNPYITAGALVAGGIYGAVSTNDKRADRQADEAKREQEQVDSATGMLTKFDRIRAAGREAEEWMSKFADATLSTADKHKMATERIVESERKQDELRAQLDQADTKKDAKKFAAIYDLYREEVAKGDKAREMRAGLKDDDLEPSSGKRATVELSDSLTRIGASVGGINSGNEALNISRDTLGVNKQMLTALNAISNNTAANSSGGSTWG